jgi:hypothetical protein
MPCSPVESHDVSEEYCDVAWESRIIRRPSLDNSLLKTIAELRSVNKHKSKNIEVGKLQKRPLSGNGSTSVFPLQLIARNKIYVLPKNENTFPLQWTETELLDSEATLAKAGLKTKDNPWTRCSRTSPRSSAIRGEISTSKNQSRINQAVSSERERAVSLLRVSL